MKEVKEVSTSTVSSYRSGPTQERARADGKQRASRTSHSSTPKEKTSLLQVGAPPRRTSGAIQGGDPLPPLRWEAAWRSWTEERVAGDMGVDPKGASRS